MSASLLREFTYYEIFVDPFVRDAEIIIPFVAFWFAVQFGTQFVAPMVSAKYRSLNDDEKQNFSVRMCSVVNGVLMFNSAYIFVDELRVNDWSLHDRFYEEIPHYRPFRLLIVSYFIWDCIVCFAYGWGWMWKLHAICSAVGTYFLAFPFSEQYATYFSGMFETSNAFIHAATMMRMLELGVGVASIFEYIFAVMFLFIRVLGGTYITVRYCGAFVPLVMRGEVHSKIPVIANLSMVVLVMALQYMWFAEIVKVALGWKSRPEDDSPKSPNQPLKSEKLE